MDHNRAIVLLTASGPEIPPEDSKEWEALAAYLETNPALAEWFATQSAADRLLADTLRTVPVPELPQLAPQMIARPIFTRRRFMGAAAAAAVAVGSGLWILERPTRFAHSNGKADFMGFQEDMARFADRLFRLSQTDKSWQPLITWLQQKKATVPVFERLPAQLTKNEAKGCRVIAWGQEDVSLLCFVKAGTTEVVHLFTANASTIAGTLPSTSDMQKPQVRYGRECAGFTTPGLVHMLVGSKPGITVAELLA